MGGLKLERYKFLIYLIGEKFAGGSHTRLRRLLCFYGGDITAFAGSVFVSLLQFRLAPSIYSASPLCTNSSFEL